MSVSFITRRRAPMRTRHSLWILLAAAFAAGGCQREYTLRLVVSGVVPVVPSDETENPEDLWLLVANATDPTQLPIPSENINVHRNGLFVEEAWAGSLGGSPGSPCRDEAGKYRWVSLDNEHLELEVDSSKGLEIERGPRVFPESEESDEARNFNWLASVDEAVGNLNQSDPKKRLAPELFAPTYKPSGYPLIAARLRLERGLVFASGLHLNKYNGDIDRFIYVPSAGDTDEVALATSVTIEMPVRGPVVFKRKRLSDGQELEPYTLGPARAGETMTVVLQNEVEGCHAATGSRDFLINYSLLVDPAAARIGEEYPSPELAGPPVDNGMCSPSRAVHPGAGA
jgi:hypothetical protein